MRLGLLLIAIATYAAPVYTVREFGVPGAYESHATAISQTGIAAGEATTQDLTRLAVLGPATLALDATAADVNSAGIAAGTTWTSAGPRATVWQDGASRTLDIWQSYGLAINDRGDVAGSGRNGGRTSAFIQSNGATTFIDAGVSASAYDVSNNGQVVGYAETITGAMRAFSWSAGQLRWLGTLGGRHSYAQAVNDSGVVVGSSTDRSGYLKAFAWNGGFTGLGTFGGTTSAAYDINSNADIVGYSTDAWGRSRAFLWRDGILLDLNTLIGGAVGWTLEAAYGINDHGQIVGAGVRDGRSTGFVLDPAALSFALAQPAQFEAMQSVESLHHLPEPSSWMLLAAGLLALGVSRRYRRT